MKFFKKTPLFRGLMAVSAFMLSLSILAGNMLEENGIMVDETLKTRRTSTVTVWDDTLFTAFVPEDIMTDGKLDPEKAKQISEEFNIRVGEEGCVLLKNNGVLPMTSEKKVTALGWWSTKFANVDLSAALSAEGISLNPAATEAYLTKDIGSYPAPGYANNKCWGKVENDEYYQSQALVNTQSGESTAFKAHEPTADELENAKPGFLKSLDEYNDLAFVCIGRASAEGADYYGSPDGVHPDGDQARNPLALTTGEKELISFAKKHFQKIVVLVRSTNTMELGELQNDQAIDAIVYVSDYNKLNIIGFVNVLTGKVSPSGALNNIYASNSLSAPAMMNQGFFRYTNADQISIYKTAKDRGANDGRVDTSTLGTSGTDAGYTNYLVEAEGIYVGYRYYETRYYDCVMNQGNAKSTAGVYDSKGDWNYSEEVVYGFGYGLSYTTFQKQIVDVKFSSEGVHNKAQERYAYVTVRVTNTGDVAGKTSVQVYGQSPYTAYDQRNSVEKAAIQLLEFGKTGVIQPGASEDVTVKVDLANLASYDANNAKTYIMDISDEYYFATGNGAHDALNNILADQGKTTADGMDYDGDPAGAYKWSYSKDGALEVDNTTFAVAKNGTAVTNQLDSSQLSYYGETNLNVTQLSRSDWQATYPVSYTGLTANETMLKYLNGHYIENVKSPTAEIKAVTWGEENDMFFGDMRFASYDDSRWETLLNKLTLQETIEFCFKGGRNFGALATIGFPSGNYAENGSVMSVPYDTGKDAINAPWLDPVKDAKSSTTMDISEATPLACSFSHELAKEYGRICGLGGLIGEKVFLWQPGINTLRTPYNGRSAQYYSEDPVLSGVNAMEACVEAIRYGSIITAKHLAFNDQELGRSGIATFMTEQRAREIELRAFQIAAEANDYDTEQYDAGLMGVMLSFSKLGCIDLTCNQAVITNILRSEWGFNGYAVSDLKDDCDLASQAFIAGLTGYDYRSTLDDVDPYSKTAVFKEDANLQLAMKEIVHRMLWCFANSNLMNKVNASTYSEWNMTWWRQAYMTATYVSAGLTAVSAALYVVSMILDKRRVNNEKSHG